MAWLSNLSLVRIGIDAERCTGCNLCASVCKAGCIDVRERAVDFSRCVACYNCFDACDHQAMQFETRLRKGRSEVRQDPERRGIHA